MRPELYALPDGIDQNSSQARIRDAFGDRLFRHIGSHRHLSDDLAEAGHPLRPVGFPAALYRVGTGENHSGVSLGGFGRPIGRSMASEFGVPRTRMTPAALARSVLPSRRALERVPALNTIVTGTRRDAGSRRGDQSSSPSSTRRAKSALSARTSSKVPSSVDLAVLEEDEGVGCLTVEAGGRR